MFSFMKWSSSHAGTKGVEFVESMPAPAKANHPPLVERPSKNLLKRKRGLDRPTNSPLSNSHSPPNKVNGKAGRNLPLRNNKPQHTPPSLTRSKSTSTTNANGHVLSSATRNGDSSMDIDSPSGSQNGEVSDPAADTAVLQHTIGTRIGFEIMMKHRELRLIEQEMAKCQAALEQIRRCELIPYPTTSQDAETKEDMINGTGVPSESGVLNADTPWQAPWGITEGPYARHYARWLLPDPAFDGSLGSEPVYPGLGIGGGLMDGRSRTGLGDGLHASKTRPHRGSAGGKLHALSSGYPQPKDKSSPLIVKRASDNQWVKLICVDCDRGDFSSAQGFINHCRIAHHRGFESHDAAAAVCGQPVELDEHGGVVGAEEQNTGGGPALVHPLIRSATEPRPSILPPPALRVDRAPSPAPENVQKLKPKPSKRKRSNSKNRKNSMQASPLFIPSLETPHLSSLMQKRGFDIDLSTLVDEAQKDVEWPSSEEDEDEATTGQDAEANSDPSQNPVGTPSDGSRIPGRAGMSPAPISSRPVSAKGLDKRQSRTHPGLSSISPRITQTVIPSPSRTRTAHLPVHPVSPPNSTTPSPITADQNAPSLISDNDESSFSAASPSTSSPSASVTDPEVQNSASESADEDASDASASDEEEEEASDEGLADAPPTQAGEISNSEASTSASASEEEEESSSDIPMDDDEESASHPTINVQTPPSPPRRAPNAKSKAKAKPKPNPRRGALRMSGAPPRGGTSRHVSFTNPEKQQQADSPPVVAKRAVGKGRPRTRARGKTGPPVVEEGRRLRRKVV